MATISRRTDLDASAEDSAFDALAEQIRELGAQGAGLSACDSRVYLSVYLDRPSLGEALLYTLHYLHDKGVLIKGVSAPRIE